MEARAVVVTEDWWRDAIAIVEAAATGRALRARESQDPGIDDVLEIIERRGRHLLRRLTDSAGDLVDPGEQRQR